MKVPEAISLVNEQIRNLKKYHLDPEQSAIKLNQNENPFDWPIEIKKEVADFCETRPWNRYPNFVPSELKQKLAAYAGVSQDGILVGNGSNEMLLVLLLSLAKQGCDVVLCQPTFTVYQLLSTGMGATQHILYLNNNLSYNVPEICKTVQQYPGCILIVCSPNNPTGSSLSKDDIESILQVHTGFFVLDQAYIEFGGYNAIPLLQDAPNLIITRTFSKAFAGAGLRLGYMLGTPEIIEQMNKIKLPYNINFFSEHVAQVMLTNRHKMEYTIKILIEQRAILVSALRALPFETVYDSDANFFMVKTPKKNELFQFLKSKSILVRDVSSYPLCENCLRINCGTPQENQALLAAAAAFFKE